MSACARNVEPAEPEGIQMTFMAYQEGAAPTKSTVLDGGTQVYWEPSDEIKVFFNGSSGRFISQNTENATSATFTGMLNVVVGGNEGAGITTKTWGLYPYRADAVLDGDAMVTTLPAAQTGRAGSFAKNTNITLAHSEGYGLAFYNVCGGVRFSLTQEGIKRITFEGNNGEALAGKIKIAFEDGVPVVSEVVAKDTVLTLTAPGGGTFQTGVWYYFSAIPGTLSGGFQMVFYKDSESAKLTSTSSVRIKRGIFGSLADADEDLMFKPSGSGDEPNPDDLIQFEDPIAKYACVEKFDTSGDGEVSYAEAAAATSLSGLFTDWNTVTSFDEIRYFTGVSSTENVFDGCSKLTQITIPDNIMTLGVFQNCSSLKTVVLPEALAALPDYCFDGCTSLTDVTLPARITTIPNYAFRNCTALASVDYPATLTSLGAYAFQNCKAITFVDSLKSITTIGSHAFSGCTALASVVLPENMTSIPAYCFQNCTALASITWPAALTAVGDYAFDGCRFEDNGYALELPSSVKTIGSNVFGFLHHLVLPSTSAISIQSNSFKANYTFLYVPDGMVEMYKVRAHWNAFAEWIRPIGDYPIYDSVEVGGTEGKVVDLGLSVSWASWNVGASAPEEYGVYFAWGESAPEPTPDIWGYSWDEYKWCNGSSSSLTKYNTDRSRGIVDNKTILDPEDDAAHANWGGNWRMPTDAEWTELRENCTWTWTTVHGVNGYRVTSNKESYTDKSIFLPAAGNWINTELNLVGSTGYYWSSSLSTSYSHLAIYASFNSESVSNGSSSTRRFLGQSVRPVCE